MIFAKCMLVFPKIGHLAVYEVTDRALGEDAFAWSSQEADRYLARARSTGISIPVTKEDLQEVVLMNVVSEAYLKHDDMKVMAGVSGLWVLRKFGYFGVKVFRKAEGGFLHELVDLEDAENFDGVLAESRKAYPEKPGLDGLNRRLTV